MTSISRLNTQELIAFLQCEETPSSITFPAVAQTSSSSWSSPLQKRSFSPPETEPPQSLLKKKIVYQESLPFVSKNELKGHLPALRVHVTNLPVALRLARSYEWMSQDVHGTLARTTDPEAIETIEEDLLALERMMVMQRKNAELSRQIIKNTLSYDYL